MPVFPFGAYDLAEDMNTYIRNDHPRQKAVPEQKAEIIFTVELGGGQ